MVTILIINNYSINYRTTLNNWLTRSGARFAALLGLAPSPFGRPRTRQDRGEDLRAGVPGAETATNFDLRSKLRVAVTLDAMSLFPVFFMSIEAMRAG